MTALAIGLWPDPESVFDPAKAGGFATALGLWLFAELFTDPIVASDPKATLDAHDAQLGRKLRAIITDDFIRFLNEHDFGSSFRDSHTAPLYELADVLRNASCAFNDPKLDEALNTINIESTGLSRMVSLGAWPKYGKLSLFTMIPDDEPDGLWSKETQSKVAATNAKADDLATALKNLLDLLRQRGMPLAVGDSS